MNRTLLVEERDDGDNRQDKKKREKEKFPDTAEKKKKMAFKKAEGKKEAHHNSSLGSSSKVQPADDMADMAAVNPNAEVLTSPVGTPVVPPPFAPPGSTNYQGNIVIPPPPRPTTLQQIPLQNLQQRGNWPQQQYQMAGYAVPHQQPQVQPHGQVPSAHFVPANFQIAGQPPVQGQFVAQPYHQVPQYQVSQYPQASGNPVQGAVYGQVVAGTHHAHVLARAQSLPSSASSTVEQVNSTGQPGWASQTPASPPPVNSGESSWGNHPAGEPREERSWKDGNNAANSSGVNNTQWAAFSPTEPPAEVPSMFVSELDEEHSSSEEEVDRSSSPELAGEEGEVLLRAPSLASFAESISSIEEESEDNLWRILPEQREYYTKQFRRLQPIEGGVVQGPRARDFFMKSTLPVEVLSKIWHLSDINKDNALNLDEFCIAMHLVVALRHGFDLPLTLPTVLLPEKMESTGSGPVSPHEMAQRMSEEDGEHETRNVSSPDHWLHFRDSLGRNAASPPLTFNNSAARRKAHSVVQPVSQKGDLQGDDENAPRTRSLSDPAPLDDAPDGQSQIDSNPASPVRPLHIAMLPSNTQPGELGPTSPSQAVTAEIEIARPRATVKPSLLDVLPGQLLPPPSGKQTRDGWTPTNKFIYQASPNPNDPLSHEGSSSPPSSPEEDTPTSPLSPDNRKTPSPPPLPQPHEEEEAQPKEDVGKGVVFRANRRSGERPRSTGDVKSSNQSDPSSPRTPGDDESQSSVSSEGRKEPPPPPPRNKKGHSRSSSLDLNKLFATKAKENKGTPPSSSSSYSSQTGEVSPPVKSEPSTPRNRTEHSSSSEAVDDNEKVQKQEDFADFSRFESFVEAQEPVNGRAKKDSPQPKLHRRSFSLDFANEGAGSQRSRKASMEATVTTGRQEALPRPVPKLKPPSPPTLKQGRRLDKDGEKERKLKTEPPKVVVRPLTKEDKLNSRIQDLKEKNASLSKVNSELQEELKTIMEKRASLELKLEQLNSPSAQKTDQTPYG